MEKQLPHVPILSLQEMTLRKVAVLLWTEPRTLVSVGNFRLSPTISTIFKNKNPYFWHETVESEVADKVPELHLPESIAKQMIRMLKPIGLQIIRWRFYHEDYLNSPKEFFDVPILQKLQWTAAGTVDYRKTAVELVRCDVFNVVKRFKLASFYCLDNYIPELLKELTHEDKINFRNDTNQSVTAPCAHYCWSYILRGEEYKLNGIFPDPFNAFVLQRASYQGNETAARYFLQKLSPAEKETFLMKNANRVLYNRYPSFFPRKHSSDLLFYFLSEMTPDQRIEIFRECPANVFACFLHWPWQDAFSVYADAMWAWMQCEDQARRARNYDTLIGKMRENIPISEYYLPNLFQNFFMSSPNDFRKHFVDVECKQGHFSGFFRELFDIQDAEAISTVFNILDAEERLRLASSDGILNLFYDSISKDRGHVVEMCLREIRLSKEDKACLREAFMTFLKAMKIEWEKIRWRRFFEYLGATDEEAKSKRSSGSETSKETLL